MKVCEFKRLAQLYTKQYFPEYQDRIERIWGMLDNVNLKTSEKDFQLGGTLGFAAGASQELREVVSGIIAIRVTYEQEKDNTFIPPQELQELIREACEKLKVSPGVKVKLEKVTIDFNNENSSNEIINEIKSASRRLNETITEEHKNTRKEINNPIVDYNYLTNWKCHLSLASREIVINKGKKDVQFQLTNLQLEIMNLLFNNSLSDDYSGEFIHWEDIIKQIPRWNIKNAPSSSNNNLAITEYDIYRHIKNNQENFRQNLCCNNRN